VEELCRMVRIVNDLEVLVAAESPDFLHPETIDVETFTQELVEGATDLGPRGWVVDAIGEGPLVADRSRLTEAVMDLADNALHHTRADQTIAIGSSSDEQETRLWVRDTGRGIEEADRERIFEIFARGDDAHRRYRGGGLGLAVVRAVADAHRGHVEVESRPGGGSTFTIVLPRSPSAGGVG
jgi:two-component system OmpR family sensor kinase